MSICFLNHQMYHGHDSVEAESSMKLQAEFNKAMNEAGNWLSFLGDPMYNTIVIDPNQEAATNNNDTGNYHFLVVFFLFGC
jgi:hypothetical protein